MSAFLTVETAQVGLNFLWPSFDMMRKSPLFTQRLHGHLALVVAYKPPWTHRGASMTRSDCLLRITWQGREPAQYNYLAYADGKAELSWDNEMSSGDVLKSSHHLKSGDILYAGSFYLNGIIVAFSGLESEKDAFMAGMLAHLLQFLCNMLTQQAKDGDVNYVGGAPDKEPEVRFGPATVIAATPIDIADAGIIGEPVSIGPDLRGKRVVVRIATTHGLVLALGTVSELYTHHAHIKLEKVLQGQIEWITINDGVLRVVWGEIFELGQASGRT